ncbi:peptidoglycan DD-metalloendopeptidase family protein [Pseudomonadota bacterium]
MNANKLYKCVALTFLFLFSKTGFAISPPEHEAVPGGVAVIPIPSTEQNKPEAHYNKKPIMVIKHDKQWHAIVGIPLSAKTDQQHHLTLTHANGTQSTLPFQVSHKDYEIQHLTIKNKRKVNPYEKDMPRINQEKKRSNTALSQWTVELLAQALKFDMPVQGRQSSSFGLKRFFNEQPRKPHSGLDIAAPTGTPINAPADGKVILTGDMFFNGNSVYLDHGQGLITMYMHMNSIAVDEGQFVKRGQPLGTVGETGRVTGPHLHWGISLNNARVNPLLFVADIYKQE